MPPTLRLDHRQVDRQSAERFVERLGDLPSFAWRAAGESARARLAERAAATAILQSVLAGAALHFEAWLIADGVETAARHHAFDAAERRGDRSLLEQWRAAHSVAATAALAVLARRLLPDASFRVLYRPFDRLVPEDAWREGSDGRGVSAQSRPTLDGRGEMKEG
jgi:hypothetical protein